MNKLKYFLILLLTFCSIFSAKSQHPYSYTINDESGLPSNEVYQVLQDDFGYMWIGCDAGLFRYDGFEYVQFKCSNQNGRSISGLQLDKKGRIWCRNFNGQVYRVNNDSLKLIADLNQNTANNIFTLDDQCNIWIVSNNQLSLFNDVGHRIANYIVPNSKGKNSFAVDIASFKGKIYLSQNFFGVYQFNPINKIFIYIPISSNVELIKTKTSFYLKDNNLYFLSEERHGKEYVISKLVKDKIEPLKHYFTKNKNVILYKILTLGNNETWICSSVGVFRDTIQSGNLDEINGLLSDKRISYCTKDREGMYWFSSLNDGIFVIPSLHVVKFDPTNCSMIDKNVSAIGIMNQKQVMIGFGSGRISEILSDNNKLLNIDIKSNQKFITTKKIQTYNGTTYIAHGQLTAFKDNQYKPLPFFNIRDFLIFKDTFYYLTSDFVFKIGMRDFQKGDQSKLIVIKKTGGRNCVVDKANNRIFFILNEGVCSYQNQKLKQLMFHGKPIYASSIVFKENKLWIASISDGLIVFQNNRFLKSFDTKNGLLENEIKCLNASKKYIWACGNTYLFRINIINGVISNFSKSSGINATEIKSIEIFNNKVYLATNNGLMVFPENFRSINSITPNIKIQSIKIGNSDYSSRNELKLSYRHQNIHINLSSVSFKSKSEFYYLYRIKNLSKEWIKIPVQNKSLILSNLPSGSFLLEIKSMNESGISSELIQLPIQIESPIWEKWWFYLLITIISVGIIATFFIIRIRFIRRRALLHSKLISSQLTALKAQMNPHFMYNALNSIQDLVLEKDIKNSNLYLSKFSKLMRKILDASGMEKISLQDEIEILNLYLELERLRFGDDFTYEIDWNHSIDTYEIHIPSMIIQPFVENAIKHGLLHKKGIKKLSINFEIKEETIVCTLIDNGVGRKHANEIKERRAVKHRSFATEATEKRIELLNKMDQENFKFEIIDLVEGDNSLGTKVIIVLPI